MGADKGPSDWVAVNVTRTDSVMTTVAVWLGMMGTDSVKDEMVAVRNGQKLE